MLKSYVKEHLPKPFVNYAVLIQDEFLSMVAFCVKKRIFTKRHNKNEKVKIAFILHSPQSWNSLKSVYGAAYNDDRIETLALVIPNNNDSAKGESISTISYFRKECGEIVNAYENGKLYDIKSFHPDIIFRQVPYEEFYPKKYRLNYLSRIAKVCYIPYNYNSSPEKHLQIEYGKKMFRYLFAIFAESDSNRIYCEKIRDSIFWNKDLRIYNLGFPRFDLYNQDRNSLNNSNSRDKMTFLWIPRWTMDYKNNNPSSFIKYKNELLDFFSNNSNVYLIIRPHPRMFSNFIDTGVMTSREVEDFKATILSSENIKLDDHFDYLETFYETDAMIADLSSLNTEFFITGKPIIYCGGSDGEYNKETERMYKLYYHVDEWKDLRKAIENLTKGIDPNRTERKEVISSFVNDLQYNIGQSIINECVNFA